VKELVVSRQFKHDLKLCQRRGYDIDRLSAVLGHIDDFVQNLIGPGLAQEFF